MTQDFDGEIKVAARIIDYLSSGLYESPAACLKELINNSYDADATQVTVLVKPDADQVSIWDDGEGMTKDEFEQHFSRVAESAKRDHNPMTGRQRPKIGKIGIGLIAANELCTVLEIHSKKRGSHDRLEVTLDFGVMSKSMKERETDDDKSVKKADYSGTITEDPDLDAHYTKIYLTSLKEPARDALVRPTMITGRVGNTIYGWKNERVTKILSDCKSWDDFDAYTQTLLQVALSVPVAYQDQWAPNGALDKLVEFTNHVKSLNFCVTYDGADLRKPVVFTGGSEDRFFVEAFDFKSEHVSARGYFYAQRGALLPEQLRGCLVRIRNASVGGYDSSFLGYPGTSSKLFQNWVSAEIWASDELEEAMNIDRRSFRVTLPAFVELREQFHEKLESVMSRVRKEFYAIPASERKIEKTIRETQKWVHAIENAANMSPTLLRSADDARSLLNALKEPEQKTRPEYSAKVLAAYSPSDVYSLVAGLARSHLDEKLYEEFMVALQRKLWS